MVSSIMLKRILEHSSFSTAVAVNIVTLQLSMRQTRKRAEQRAASEEARPFWSLAGATKLEGILMLCYQKSRLRTQHTTFLKMGAICI